MQLDAGKNVFLICPSDRRKMRANVLKLRRTTPTLCKSEPDALSSATDVNEATKAESTANVSITEDKKATRKLRNRASALASRNKRTEEIEALTYRLGKILLSRASRTPQALLIRSLKYSLLPQMYRTDDRRSREAEGSAVKI